MRSIPATRLITAVCLMLCAMSAPAQDDATKKEIEAQYAKIAQEIQKGQATDAAKVTLPDFKHTSYVGKEGKIDQWANELKLVLTPFKAPEAKTTLLSATLKGDQATAVFSTKFSGEGTLTDGRAGALDYEVVERTLWAKGEGGWRLKATKHVWLERRIEKRLIPFKTSGADEEIRGAIQPIYEALANIYTKNEFDTLDQGIADDYPIFDSSGAQLTKAQLIDRLRQGAKLLVNPVVFMTIQQIGHEGDAVKIVRLATILSEVKLPNGTTGRLKYINVARDTWKKGEKNWVNQKTEELFADAQLDGKPIPLSLLGGQ